MLLFATRKETRSGRDRTYRGAVSLEVQEQRHLFELLAARLQPSGLPQSGGCGCAEAHNVANQLVLGLEIFR